MLMRQGSAGLPLMRTRTGSGLRQPGLMAFDRKALTRMKGLTPLIFMTAVKPKVVIGISAGIDVKTPMQGPFRPCGGTRNCRNLIIFMADNRGGLNGSTQHSARSHIALKTKAKIAR